MVTEFREELRKAREAAQLLKEATEAEKQAVYDLGVQETQSCLIEEFSTVARDYCDITWGKALDVAGVPADSNLRAYIMTRTSVSSQVLALLPQNILPKCLRCP